MCDDNDACSYVCVCARAQNVGNVGRLSLVPIIGKKIDASVNT